MSNSPILYMTGFLILAHSVESVLGFGATIIAFGFGAHFFPIDSLVVMLILLAIIQSSFLLFRWFRHIQWNGLFTFIIPVSLVGVLGGIVIRNYVNEGILKLILGLFILALSLIELYLIIVKKNESSRNLTPVSGFILLLTGGLFHGLLAIGGPLIVYYASRRLTSQESIRGTLAFIWLLLNFTMIAGFIVNNRITPGIIQTTGFLMPGLILGIAAGQLLKIGDIIFKVITYILLAAIGCSLICT